MRRRIGELYYQGAFQEAADILSRGLTAFPDHLVANVFNLALCQVQLSDQEGAINTLQVGLEQGVWFGPYEIGIDAWGPIKEINAFKEIHNCYEQLREGAQKKARPILHITLPIGYDPKQAYPLFVALHGGGETVEGFKENWTSTKLEGEFIVAYPQSSRVVSMRGFSWMGDPHDQQEIASAYKEVLRKHRIDTKRIIMGGFSAGGHLTLTLLLGDAEVVPMRGFVVLCPPVPKVIPFQAVERILERRQRGVLLTTEMDCRLIEQEKLAMVFESGGVPLKFEIFPNSSHWYPPDLGDRIDNAITYILK